MHLFIILFSCFPTSQRNAKMYKETSILHSYRIQVLFLSPLFLPFLLYFSLLLSFSFFFLRSSPFRYISFFLCLASSCLSSLSFPSFNLPVFCVVQRIPYICYSNYRRTETPTLFFGTLVKA